jgi:hypothetical protein
VFEAVSQVVGHLAGDAVQRGLRTPSAVVTGTSGLARGTFLSQVPSAIGERWGARVVRLDASSLVDTLRDGLVESLSETGWWRAWVTAMARAAGLPDREAMVFEPAAEPVVFVLGDLDDLFSASAMLVTQERMAIRSLLIDSREWLASLQHTPYGFLAVASPALVRAALPQNSAQFLAVHRSFSLDPK